MTKEATPVIFRAYRTGEIIALFPYEPARYLRTASYMHVGQHGEADYDNVISQTKPATPEQYADLAAELRGLGYELKPIAKANRRKMAVMWFEK